MRTTQTTSKTTNKTTNKTKAKPYIGMPMENGVARRYAEQRRSGRQLDDYRRQARDLTAGLADGARVLEVAPGPGYLAIEMAKLGRYRVSGVDISRTFVDLAAAAAQAAGVDVDFRLGDAADLPFDDGTFDLIVCQAAFKNFSQPAAALADMHRVLAPGGTAVVQDMTKAATRAGIRREVEGMALRPISAFMTRRILGWLKRRAYTPDAFQQLVAASPFGTCEFGTSGIGFEARMTKRPG